MNLHLAPARWTRINYYLELVKNEGDFECLQAMEDLLESCIAWRAYGLAWRNLVEGLDRDSRVVIADKERDKYQRQCHAMQRDLETLHFVVRDIQRIVEGVI